MDPQDGAGDPCGRPINRNRLIPRGKGHGNSARGRNNPADDGRIGRNPTFTHTDLRGGLSFNAQVLDGQNEQMPEFAGVVSLVEMSLISTGKRIAPSCYARSE